MKREECGDGFSLESCRNKYYKQQSAPSSHHILDNGKARAQKKHGVARQPEESRSPKRETKQYIAFVMLVIIYTILSIYIHSRLSLDRVIADAGVIPYTFFTLDAAAVPSTQYRGNSIVSEQHNPSCRSGTACLASNHDVR